MLQGIFQFPFLDTRKRIGVSLAPIFLRGGGIIKRNFFAFSDDCFALDSSLRHLHGSVLPEFTAHCTLSSSLSMLVSFWSSTARKLKMIHLSAVGIKALRFSAHVSTVSKALVLHVKTASSWCFLCVLTVLLPSHG